MVIRVFSFDLWGDLGHFKRHYTTSSPLTFSFPPKTAIFGIFGAILGLPKYKYLSILNRANIKISLQLIQPVKKIRMGLKWIKADAISSMHKVKPKLTTCEFLKNCHYRIFVACDDEELYNQLILKIKNKQNVYSISLGLSELLADLKYIDETFVKLQSSEDYVPIHSILPLSSLMNGAESIQFSWNENIKYQKERTILYFSTERQPLRYEDFIFEVTGKEIYGKVKEFITFHTKNIILF